MALLFSANHRFDPPIVFTTKLSIFLCMKCILCGNASGVIYYFEKSSQISISFCNFLHNLGYAPAPKQVTYNFSQVKDCFGRSLYRSTLIASTTILQSVAESIFCRSPLVEFLSRRWDKDTVVLHLSNYYHEAIRKECLRVVMTKWMVDHLGLASPPRIVLYVLSSTIFPWLRDFADSNGVELKKISNFGFYVGRLCATAKIFRSRLKDLTVRRLRSLRHCALASNSASPSHRSPQPPPSGMRSIAVKYGYRPFSTDPRSRSELFWLQSGLIPSSNVLWFGVDNCPNTVAVVSSPDYKDLAIFGDGTSCTAFHPTPAMRFSMLGAFFFLFLAGLTSAAKMKRYSMSFLRPLLELIAQTTYWTHFFNLYGVKVVLIPSSQGSASYVLAMNSLNGISISFQYSIAIANGSSSVYHCAENLHLIFSNFFRPMIEQKSRHHISHAETGYIDDIALHTRIDSSSKSFYTSISNAGASFIIAFFDENTAERWDIHAPHDIAIKDYSTIFKWVLEDTTIGFIIKPKAPATLLSRIAPIKCLLDQALATGRCIIMDIDPHSSRRTYPCDAARICDFSIGLLMGATASFEAALIGVPACLLDHEHSRLHPFHAFDDGNVIFQSWELLRAAIMKYRESPRTNAILGDWSKWIDKLDAFRDGQAHLRIATIVKVLADALASGMTPDEALEELRSQYEHFWPGGHVQL